MASGCGAPDDAAIASAYARIQAAVDKAADELIDRGELLEALRADTPLRKLLRLEDEEDEGGGDGADGGGSRGGDGSSGGGALRRTRARIEATFGHAGDESGGDDAPLVSGSDSKRPPLPSLLPSRPSGSDGAALRARR